MLRIYYVGSKINCIQNAALSLLTLKHSLKCQNCFQNLKKSFKFIELSLSRAAHDFWNISYECLREDVEDVSSLISNSAMILFDQ